MEQALVNRNTDHLSVVGHVGKWHVIDEAEVAGNSYFLLEHDTYGDEAASLIVDKHGKLILDEVYNGFDEETREMIEEVVGKLATHEQTKHIFFTDSNAKMVFSIPDGGFISMALPNRETKIRQCKYVSPEHFQIDDRIYHQMDFAYQMEHNSISFSAMLDPEIVQGYMITDKIQIDKITIVIAHNPKAPNPYVTWRGHAEREGYDWGHYYNHRSAAELDYHKRANDEHGYQRPFSSVQQRNDHAR